jgi:hypothetical protein
VIGELDAGGARQRPQRSLDVFALRRGGIVAQEHGEERVLVDELLNLLVAGLTGVVAEEAAGGQPGHGKQQGNDDLQCPHDPARLPPRRHRVSSGQRPTS